MDWLRLWHDLPNDPKLRTIARKSGQPITAVLSVFVHMLVNASMSESRGTLSSWEDEDIASALDIDTEQVTAIREAMQGRLLDGDVLTGWNKRQPLREDVGSTDEDGSGAMSAAERKRLQRQREREAKQAEMSRDVTHCHDMSRDVTHCHAPERDRDTEKDIKTTTLSPARDNSDQFPETFTPDAHAESLARQHNLNLQTELDTFAAHYRANGESRSNWQAAFHKWLLNSMQYQSDRKTKSNGNPRASPARSPATQMQDERLRIAREITEAAKHGRNREIDITGSAVVVDGQAVRSDGGDVRPALVGHVGRA